MMDPRRSNSKSSGSDTTDKESPDSVRDFMVQKRVRNPQGPSLRSRTGTTRRKKSKHQQRERERERDVLPLTNGPSRKTGTNGESLDDPRRKFMSQSDGIGAASTVFLHRLWQCLTNNPISKRIFRVRNILIVLLLIGFMDVQINFRRSYVRYFGMHPIHGGFLGVKVDRYFLQKVIDSTRTKTEERLSEIGLVLPGVHPTVPTELLQINTNAALREYLMRRELRSLGLIRMEESAEKYLRNCQQEPDYDPLQLFQHSSRQQEPMVPQTLFVPSVASWKTPRPDKPRSFWPATFLEFEMRELIEDTFNTMLDTYTQLESQQDRINLWSLCALYFYGGLFLSESASRNERAVEALMNGEATSVFRPRNSTDCTQPVGLVSFTNEGQSPDLFLIATTPRHPHLRCVLSALEGARKVDASSILSAFFLGAWDESHTSSLIDGDGSEQSHHFEEVVTKCGYGHAHKPQCCHEPSSSVIKTLPQRVATDEPKGKFFIHRHVVPDHIRMAAEHHGEAQVEVHVRMKDGTEAPVKSVKSPLQNVMERRGVAPGWFCNRCMKTALYGTFKKCRPFCPRGYERTMCSQPDDPEKAEVTVEVSVVGYGKTPKRVPRIIHQTWFEEISPDRYPELLRLQNSWKNTGWDYRFYTDESASQYIRDHFPQRFVDAFDSVVPGAYKADLFRYLVLLRDGGVYADVDIMLDANLDTFVTESMSFFAARDVVCEYADESFCLWNGLMGSEPGHPFMVRAVERVINLILDRADMYDMERDACKRMGPAVETWKVRAEPLLMSSGPCALGIAVNEALGRDMMSRFDIGWISMDNFEFGGAEARDYGDALIMVGDKYDLGAFRISDPERSFILASTDMPGVAKEPRIVSNPTRAEKRRQLNRRKALPHYSEAARGEFIWGMHKVYHDDLVNNEVLKFKAHYQ